MSGSSPLAGAAAPPARSAAVAASTARSASSSSLYTVLATSRCLYTRLLMSPARSTAGSGPRADGRTCSRVYTAVHGHVARDWDRASASPAASTVTLAAPALRGTGDSIRNAATTATRPATQASANARASSR